MKRHAILLLTAWVAVQPGCAQIDSTDTGGQAEKVNRLSADLQLFTRGEIRDGGLLDKETLNENDDRSQFVLGRARLVINYQRPHLETRMTMQHSGVWGQSGKGAFNLNEIWAKLSADNGLFAQVGRVALSYDDERIIGINDWAMASLSHDVLRLGYEGHGHKAHAILAYNQNAENMQGGSYYANGAQPYKSMQTLWYHYDVPRVPVGFSLLFMNIGMQGGKKDQDAHTENQQLFGGYASFQPPHWKVEGSYYRQTGKNEDGMDIKAWMTSVKASFSPSDTYGFEAGYDYLSGDKYFAVPPEGGLGITYHKTVEGFNPVYGSHHKFYGAMDFFYVTTYVNGFTPGLQNTFVGVNVKPLKGLSLIGRYHYLATATELTDMDKTLGHEIELQASYNVMKDVRVSAGFSFMVGTDTMKRLKRASDQNSMRWYWLSLNVSPRIFSIQW